MMNLRDLRLRLRAIVTPSRVERELGDELAFHLERETRKLVASGLDPAEARRRARARFGSPARVADQCRDAHGTAFVDACVRDVIYACRTFRQAPLVALTIVGTVALGLGLVAAAFTIFSNLLFDVDAVANPGELFAVERPRPRDGERARFTRTDYDALRRETDVFVDVFARLHDIDSRIDGRMMEGTLVTGNFFQVLGVGAALGRTLVPADDERFAPRPVMVLSHPGWERLFAADPAAVGRRVLVNGAPYEIVGVMPKGFRGLALGSPDYWAPYSLVGQFRPIHAGREDALGIDIIGRLKPGLSPKTALAGLVVWSSARRGSPAGSRAPNITLEPRRGTLPQPHEALIVFGPIFFAFGLILMIGCANVANLLLARGVSRQREIGIRLSLGASRGRIVRQLLTENLLLALASAACAFVLSRAVLQLTVYSATTTMAAEIAEKVRLSAPTADWRVALFLVASAVASTVFFGLAPALQATRLELVRTMRGEMTRDARPSRARHALITLQVGASALLLICAAVFLQSAMASASVDSGLRTSDTVIVDIVSESSRAAMYQAVAAHPSVAAVAASWPDTLGRPRAGFIEPLPAAGGPAAKPNRLPIFYRFASPEYFAVLDITVLRGRAFSPAEAAPGTAAVMLSSTTARDLWPNQEAVGQVLRLEPDPLSETRRLDEPPLVARVFTVVGVVKDVAGFRFAGFKEAGVYLPIGPGVAKTSLTLRVNGDPDVARRALVERLTPLDPNMGSVVTLRTLASLETYFLQIAFWVTVVLGALALLLTLSGLFSVLSYLVEQRAKEIGVRMALGATTGSVAMLVLRQTVRPVGIGLAAGCSLAAALATVLLSTPAASLMGEIVHVFDPVAYIASLLCIVSACGLAASIPAWRASRIDPIATLRQE